MKVKETFPDKQKQRDIINPRPFLEEILNELFKLKQNDAKQQYLKACESIKVAGKGKQGCVITFYSGIEITRKGIKNITKNMIMNT